MKIKLNIKEFDNCYQDWKIDDKVKLCNEVSPYDKNLIKELEIEESKIYTISFMDFIDVPSDAFDKFYVLELKEIHLEKH